MSMYMRIPPLTIEIMSESNPLKSRILVRRLAVARCSPCAAPSRARAPRRRSDAADARCVQLCFHPKHHHGQHYNSVRRPPHVRRIAAPRAWCSGFPALGSRRADFGGAPPRPATGGPARCATDSDGPPPAASLDELKRRSALH